MRRVLAVLVLVLVSGLFWWLSRDPRPHSIARESGVEAGGDPAAREKRAARTVRWGGGADEESGVFPEDGTVEEIHGRVLDAITRAPIPDATVTLRSGSGEVLDETWSDAAGTFLFPPGSEGRAVAAQATGYAFASARLGSGRRDSGGRRPSEPVVLELDGAVVVAGRVVGANRDAIPGAEVWVRDAEGWRWPAAVSSTVQTDRDGNFRVEDAPAGRLVVHARADGHAPGESEVGMVGPGRTRENVRVELRDGGVVVGRVVDSSGVPASGATVLAMVERTRPGSSSGVSGGPARSRDDGRFRIDSLPAGRTWLAARTDDGAGTAEVEVREGLEVEVELRLAETGTVEGVVVDGTGAPLEGVSVQAYFMDWRDESAIALDEARQVREKSGARNTTDADGSFKLSGLAAERVRLSAWGPARGSITRTVQVGARDVVLALDGTVVRGIVERADGRPLEGPANVEIAGGSRWSRRSVTADPEFSISLDEGTSDLVATAAGFRDGSPVSVVVKNGEPVPFVRLRLGSSGVLRGRLVGDDGRPVVAAHVSVSGGPMDDAGGEGGRLDWSAAVRSGPGGRFELPCGGGEVRAFVFHPEYEPEIVRVRVPEDGVHDAGAIRLRRGEGASSVVEFSGIGAVIDWDDDRKRYRIVGLIPGGPAERAGVRKEDGILEVNGESVTNASMGDLIARIRGPVGTTVALLLDRAGNLEPLRIYVVREKIRA